MVQRADISLSSVVLGQLVDKAMFIPALILMVAFLDPATIYFPMIAIIVGSACTAAGGFYAAKRAGRAFVLHGFLVAVITVLISFIRYLNPEIEGSPPAHPLWWEILAWSSSILAGLSGGWYGKRRAVQAAT